MSEKGSGVIRRREEAGGRLRWIVIDRPDKANALTPGMLEALCSEIEDAARSVGLAALVITGSGDKVFSAGADIGGHEPAMMARLPLWERLSDGIAALPCLTIAAIGGTLAGGAFGMALACDLRVAVPHARFFYPALARGVLPQPADIDRLTRLVGPGRARLMLMAGAKLDAAEAEAAGLVEMVVPPSALAQTVRRLAAPALDAPPALLAALKRLMTAPRDVTLRQRAFAAVYDGDEAALAALRAGASSPG